MNNKRYKINNKIVHPIGIGTWGMGGNMSADYSNDEKHIEAIKYSLSKGQNHIDTAQLYGAGHTDDIVGKAISGFDRSKIIIATKVWRENATEDGVIQYVNSALEKYGKDYIDLLYIHADWQGLDLESCVKGMNKCVDEGLVKELGVSNFSVNSMKKFNELSKYPIKANQVYYNFWNRDEVSNQFREYCLENDILIVAYRPLELGNLQNSEELEELAQKYNSTTSQAALLWLINQENVITIPKSSSKEHIDANLVI